jgi:hypothetical protein
MRNRILPRLLLASGVLLASGACEDFDFETYVANLEGSQEVPPVASAGSGRAVLLVSRNGDRADISVTLTGIDPGVVTGAHIHRAPRGVNGSVIFNLWIPEARFGTFQAPFGRSWSSSVSDPQALTAENLADLRAGRLYVNVHTRANQRGEIRGQLERQ